MKIKQSFFSLWGLALLYAVMQSCLIQAACQCANRPTKPNSSGKAGAQASSPVVSIPPPPSTPTATKLLQYLDGGIHESAMADHIKFTAIQEAAQAGDQNMLQRLVNHGVNINTKSNGTGNTPLISLAEGADVNALQCLLQIPPRCRPQCN